ncbi:protein-glutamate methylesterase/protein-glutamine glutaminase [Idiomarina xiamenensis]|uniref:Protein-glutamate methylesterase/protein-glutamine glutaminase n=1 Tax=Idiomarina xiamenensis 10-D-4 TaxID=740709 RepID=K2JZE1_9GAMM|nr:chemotaxis response regulator protein-glutamate methylesterase [Idiomarina xiamenensis]EKE80818.1 chemotaxis-specific methylesterase [Idiomarina xiamenensis 10-D-4]
MAVKVLVVDDSAFFRRRVTEILSAHAGIEVIGTANNGEEAVAQVMALRPDVVTMDVEMPVMDGITAVKAIMAKRPMPILMFSSLTHEGAKATLDALEAGAADFLPKKFEDIARQRDDAVNVLQQRVLAIAKPSTRLTRPTFSRANTESTARTRPSTTDPSVSHRSSASSSVSTPLPKSLTAANSRYQLFAIGTSTGGPVALQTILTQLPANFPYPIVMVQHMPAAFTRAFAQRLNGLCQIEVKEAEDGDSLKPGCAYLAPGGKQMLVDGRSGAARLRIHEDKDPRITYRPSVDITFASAAKVYGGKVLGIILTGMGADGREGSRLLKQAGAEIWAQDEASCVVYGMPMAVTQAGIASKSLALNDVAGQVLREVGFR